MSIPFQLDSERQITARFGLTVRFRLRYEDDESEMCTVARSNQIKSNQPKKNQNID
jgi:hypothetical protein